MKLRSLAILAAALSLAGCTLPSTSPTAPVNSAITGNWEITLTSTTRPGYIYTFGIYLTQSGSTVSGIGSWIEDAFPQCIASGFLCGYPFEVLNPNLAGTVNASGNVAFGTTIAQNSPGTLSITANAPTDGLITGTYTITYDTLVDQGTVSATMIAPLIGTYAGTLTSSTTGLSMGVSTTLTQTSSATSGFSNAFLGFAGSAAFTGSSCISSAPIPVSGTFLGNQLEIELTQSNSPTATILLTGTLSPDAKTLVINFYSDNSACGNDSGSGTLTRQ